ncbi:MAG: HEAT repeat domain-containing protein [Phycisphaerae bacterium]|nr:HEAT repeat domain-containing protein [Phycisphaerae bacterium]
MAQKQALWTVPALFCLAGLATTAGQTSRSADDLPSVEEWINVNSVPEEYDHIQEHFKKRGESYRIERQYAGEHQGRHFDRIDTISDTTGSKTVFVFDTTAIFDAMSHARSPKARKAAHDALQARYPNITPALLPELKPLLQHPDVHHRTWAVDAIAHIPTDDARQLLVDGLAHTSIWTNVELHLAYKKAAQDIGAPIVRQIARRLPSLRQERRWQLIGVLGDIEDASVCSVIESELRTGPARNRRACYLSLAARRCRESMPLLLDALAQAGDAPDDALLWAMGRCGDSEVYDRILHYVTGDPGPVRCAAIAGLGYLGDARAIPVLLDIAKRDTDHIARCNAIYSLGNLRAVEALPLLLELVKQRGDDGAYHSMTGVYDMEVLDVHENSFVEVSARALSQIADNRAIPVLRALLNDDEYQLYETNIAEAAARAGWREMVPDLITRFQTTHPMWAKYQSSDEEVRERISPSLRTLTGQTFGEDPQAWAQWWAASESSGSASPSSRPADRLPRNLKGYELYCWRENGQLRFTLLPGTNRNKLASEIFVPVGQRDGDLPCISVAGLDALHDLLARLPRGKSLVVSAVKRSESDELAHLDTPEDVSARIRAEAERLGLNLVGLP